MGMRLPTAFQLTNILLNPLSSLIHSFLGPLLDLFIAEVVDDGLFVKILVFPDFFFDGLVDIGVDDSGVATDIHLRL